MSLTETSDLLPCRGRGNLLAAITALNSLLRATQEQQSKSSKWLNDIWGLKKMASSFQRFWCHICKTQHRLCPTVEPPVRPQSCRHIREREVTLPPCESPWQAGRGTPSQSAPGAAKQNLYDTVGNTPTELWEKEKDVKGALIEEHIFLQTFQVNVKLF